MSNLNCPKCGAENAGEEVCDACGGQTTGQAWSPVLRAARAFRGLLTWFGIQQLLGIATQAVGPLLDHGVTRGGMTPIIMLGLLVLILASTLVMLVQVYRLASAMGSPVALLWVLGMLMPCLSFILLLVLNSNAKVWLEKRGLKVGFLGPAPEAITKLEEQARSEIETF